MNDLWIIYLIGICIIALFIAKAIRYIGGDSINDNINYDSSPDE